MADDDVLFVSADKLSMAIYQGEVVAVFDLSSKNVFPKELGLRLLPVEARALAQQLEQLAAAAEIGLPRA